MSEEKWYYTKSVLANISPTEYASLNTALEAIGANVRIGPPKYMDDSADPILSHQVGLYMNQDDCVQKGRVSAVYELSVAIQNMKKRLLR